MTSSLNVYDMYASSHRSKSPGGRHRDRSRSRDRRSSRKDRSHSRRPSRYHEEDLDDDPRFVDPRREKPKTYYDDDDSADDGVYNQLAKLRYPPRHYDFSDDDEEFPSFPAPSSSSMRRSKSGSSRPSKSYAAEKLYYDSERERDKRYSSRHLLRPEAPKPSRYAKYSDPVLDVDDDYYDDNDDDEGLAYGAKDYYGYPPSRRHRSRSRGRVPKVSKEVYYDDDDSDGSLDYGHHRTASRSRTRDENRRSRIDAATPKAAAAANSLDDYDKYLRHIQNLQSDAESRRRAPSQGRHRSKSAVVPPAPELDDDDDDWAAIPECERPDFVPPSQQPDPVPVGVQNTAPPASAGRYSFANIPGLGFLKGNAAPTQASPAQNDSYFPQGIVADNQPQPPPPPPPPPQAPQPQPQHRQQPQHQQQPHHRQQPVPHPTLSPVQYPMVPPSQYMQQQYPSRQYPPPNEPYVRPMSVHQRAASTGGARGDPRDYASPTHYQYAKVNPDVKYTSTPVKPSVQQVPTSQSPQTLKYSANPVAHIPDISQYLEVNSKPGLRRTTTARPHSVSFSSPQNDHMNVPGSFPDPAPPPEGPPVQTYHRRHKGRAPAHWPESFSKYVNDDPTDGNAAPSAAIKRSHSKGKKADKLNEKVERWVQLNRKTGSLESITSSKPPVEPEPVYDPELDAKALKAALLVPQNTRDPKIDPKPLTLLLPYLTSEEMAILRAEYKRIVRVNGQGLNLAKHIMARALPGNFAKACHATALGQWDSEAYFIKMYRENPQRRELLIETLVGRTHAEIEKIKACYKANYGDSLEKVMRSELKADKFRMAIILSLTESRQPDDAPPDTDLIQRDVRALRRALVDGSEVDILSIILTRSDAHLREVLHLYKRAFNENFARGMIAKSRNVIVRSFFPFLLSQPTHPPSSDQLTHFNS